MLARVVWPAFGDPGGVTCPFHALGAPSPTNTFSRALIKRKPADSPGDWPFLSVPSLRLMAGEGGSG